MSTPTLDSDPRPATFAQRLRDARLNAELSVAELADKAKLPEATIHRIEGGAVTKPQIRTLRSLGHALGVTVAVLSGTEQSL